MKHSIGKLFREKRIKSGLSQAEIARKLKIKPQFVSNWERSISSPPLRLYKRLGKMLEINPHLIAEQKAHSAYNETLRAMK